MNEDEIAVSIEMCPAVLGFCVLFVLAFVFCLPLPTGSASRGDSIQIGWEQRHIELQMLFRNFIIFKIYTSCNTLLSFISITSSTQSFIHKILFTFAMPLLHLQISSQQQRYTTSTRRNKHQQQQQQHHYGRYWIFQEILFENSPGASAGFIICSR